MLVGDAGGSGAGLVSVVFCYLALTALLLLAALSDLKHHRISNRLVAGGLVFAFAFHFLVPSLLGVGRSALGMLLGFAMLLPFYLLRGMAAGDVKLMSMVGAFLGPALTFWAVVATFLVGGVWAVVAVSRRRAWSALVTNLLHMPTRAADPALPIGGGGYSLGRIPYAVAIAGGTTAVLVVEMLSR